MQLRKVCCDNGVKVVRSSIYLLACHGNARVEEENTSWPSSEQQRSSFRLKLDSAHVVGFFDAVDSLDGGTGWGPESRGWERMLLPLVGEQAGIARGERRET